MKDPFNREIRSLRISVTPHCNLKCFYCHREGYRKFNGRYMTPEEIGKIVKTFSEFGIKKIKISGGEPLLREDLPEIIESISHRKIKEISLTTNGILLKKYAEVLKDAGLHRVNVSLDTLDPEKYRRITTYGDVELVKAGIERAIEVGLTPLKINYLAMKNTLEDLEDLMDYCREVGAILQVIELMPLNENLKKYYVDITPIEKKIGEMADKVVTRRSMHNRRKYYIGNLEVEFVRPMDNTEFCSHCTRIRLTYDGYIKPCLLREDNLVDILTPLRRGEDIRGYIRQGILRRGPYFKGDKY
ncbi:GTP 3',8-cyclase MoaA [Methanothermococcus sp. SCGC AD-155-N22]|nr:GTP 3',8-cyclase MoaA [Methanothermococcus sp. SCGC AD-155-N22]